MSENNDRSQPVFSPVGERGPIGDTGEKGDAGKSGSTGQQGDDGDRGRPGLHGSPGIQGERGPEGPVVVVGRSRTSQTFNAISIFLFILSLVLSQLFAWNLVRTLQNQVDDYARGTIINREEEACQTLYRNDLNTTIGQALAATNDLLISAAGRPAAISEEERIAAAEENNELALILAERNQPLLNAVDALLSYQSMDPPPLICPHPDSVQDPIIQD